MELLPDLNTEEEYILCPLCKTKLKKINLSKHLQKHEHVMPVSKDKDKILWYQRPLCCDDFSLVRRYVDACLTGLDEYDNNFPATFTSYTTLTSDANLLHELIEAMEKLMPESLPIPSFPDYFPISNEFNLQTLPNEMAKEMLHKYNIVKEHYYEIYTELNNFLSANHSKREILTLLKKRLELASTNGMLYIPINWEVLPPGCDLLKELKNYYHQLGIRNEIEIDESRLKKISSLKPNSAYRGRNNFDGYCVFLFDKYNETILENPIVGNATYLITGEWEKLTHLSKKELLDMECGNVNRLVHCESWFSNLKKELTLKSVKTIKKKPEIIRLKKLNKK